MIGLVIVTYEGLALEFRRVVEHLMGPQEAFETVGIDNVQQAQEKHQELAEKVAQVEQGAGVLILTDMFGGTASHLAMSMLNRDNLEVIAGVNLPLLVKLVSVRQSLPLCEAADVCQAAAKASMNVASHFLAAG